MRHLYRWLFGAPSECAACAAKDAEIAYLRVERTLERSQFMAESRNLTDKLTALGDAKAQATVFRHDTIGAPTVLPEDKPQRPSLRFPPNIQALVGGGHVNLSQIRKDHEERPFLKGRIPPGVKG